MAIVKCRSCGKAMSRLAYFWARYCSNCRKDRKDSKKNFQKKYKDSKKKLNTDAKACAWLALSNLLCAERVNTVCVFWSVAQLGEPLYHWKFNKEKAIECANLGLQMLSDGAVGKDLLLEILKRANALTSSSVPEVQYKLSSTALPIFRQTYFSKEYMEDSAHLSGKVSIEDVNAALQYMPEGNWLLTDQDVAAST